MDQEQYFTDYDILVQTRELQMMKAMLPFVNTRSQMPLALLIQSIEFRNTMKLFQTNTKALSACAIKDDNDKRSAMLQTLRRFCTPKERETIDTLMNIMFVMENYDNIPN